MDVGFPYENQVSSEQELRAILEEPQPLVKRKVIPCLDRHCLEFIARSPLLVLSTADQKGYCDASPRGDDPGFVRVLDARRLLIPDRPGNRRGDSMRNLLSNPHIGLIFFIPGLEETLRVNGQACVTRDPALLKTMQIKGKTPTLAIGVVVRECYIHCAKALKRAKLWESETWLEKSDLPNAAEILADHAGFSKQETGQLLHESYTQRLY